MSLTKREDGTCLVSSRSASALRHAHVGDHVSERIGLDDGDHADLGVLCEKVLVSGRQE